MTAARLALAAALLPLVATRADTPPAGDAALARLAWLVGGKWVAVLKGADGSPVTVEMTVAWAGHRKALKYAIDFKTNGRSFTQYEGAFWWHPGRKQLVMLQIDRAGHVTEAVVSFDGALMRTDNTLTRADGSTQRQRTELTRDGDDAYAFKAFVPKGDAWVEAASFKYKRVREAK